MGVIQKVTSIFKKKKKEPTITITELPAEKKPDVTFVDVGREAPKGYEFVDEKGKSQGDFVRTGGYTVVGRSAGGGGSGGSRGTIVPGSESGEVTSSIARSFEGVPDQTVKAPQTDPNKTYNLSPQLQKQIELEARQRKTARGTDINFAAAKRQQTQKVYPGPYFTRKEPSVRGYTKSGKPLFKEGEAIVINPFAEQFGQVKERAATPDETAQLVLYEQEQGINYDNIFNYKTRQEQFGLPNWAANLLGPKATKTILKGDPNELTKELRYNPEDLGISLKGNTPAGIRGAGYDFAGSISQAIKKISPKGSRAYNFFSTEKSQAKFRGLVGETALYSFFAPGFTTAAQTAVKVAEPAKVLSTGTYQRVGGRVAETDLYFTAIKGGKTFQVFGKTFNIGDTKYSGVVTGRASATAVKVGDLAVYKIKAGSAGVAFQKALEVPRGLVYRNVKAFTTFEKGLAFKTTLFGQKRFVSFTKGSIGIKEFLRKGTSFSYRSGAVQTTGKKGVTFIAGGTVSPKGYSEFASILFPRRTTPFTFIPKAAKAGQVTFFTPSSLFKPSTTLSITRRASATAAFTGAGAFAQTIPYAGGASFKAAQLSIFNLPTSKQLLQVKPSLQFREGTREIQGFNFSTKEITKTATTTKTIARSRSGLAQILQPKTAQVATQKVTVKQAQKTKQIQKLIPFRPVVPKIRVTPKTPKGFSFPGIKTPIAKQGFFTVYVRRFGQFRPVGKTKTQREAFGLGIFKTKYTLGATFKVSGKQKPTNLFGYTTKKTKQGIFYIEQPRFRLSTGSEKKEIQYFKALKRGLF